MKTYFKGLWNNRSLHIMMVPSIILAIIFCYIPMIGIVIAFQDYNPNLGFFSSPFIGFENFQYMIDLPDTMQAVFNTLRIATMNIIAGIITPVMFAILLNELKFNKLRRVLQTAVYLPHFMSWVILGGILIDVLSPSQGIVNALIKALGFKPVFFLGNADIFPYVLVVTNQWKEFGFGTIIYLASITSISPSLYESAAMDGAGRLKQMIHITLPGITPIIILLSTLSLGSILNAGFDQVFNLYSPLVYSTGDIIDTLTYRIGLIDMQYGVSTAIGLFKSVVSCILIVISYKLAYKLANYRIF
jgi:putative aldouronate transport system permease protein